MQTFFKRIILDSFLTYDDHITEVVSKCLAASSLPNQSCETFAGYIPKHLLLLENTCMQKLSPC
jgi:hypothetical protein